MELKNETYEIQGHSVARLAEDFGTPLYVYNGNTIIEQYNKLNDVFKGVDLKLKYACKALTNINILKLLKAKTGAGIDTVSINEIKIALKAGFSPSEIIFTPNCVDFAEVEEAIEIGVHINIDNLPFLEMIGQKYGGDQPVCIRINPHIQAGGNANIQVGHIGSKFGVSYLQFSDVKKIVEQYGITVEGLHIHTGSDILDADVFLMGAKVLFDIAKDFKDLKFMDFGSGFKVAYQEGQHVTNIARVGEKMSAAFKEFCAAYGRELEIWFEPGKFLVSESGSFIVKANLIKHTPACTFIGVDSGFNHLIRPMMYDAYHDIVNVSNPNGEQKVYNVVGNICETDTFASERDIAETKEGDLLVFKNAGAYGIEMASNFNSRLKPAEVLVLDGEAKQIRRRQEFEDLLRDQIEIDL